MLIHNQLYSLAEWIISILTGKLYSADDEEVGWVTNGIYARRLFAGNSSGMRFPTKPQFEPHDYAETNWAIVARLGVTALGCLGSQLSTAARRMH